MAIVLRMIAPDVPRRSPVKQLRPLRGESGRGDGERADNSSCALAGSSSLIWCSAATCASAVS